MGRVPHPNRSFVIPIMLVAPRIFLFQLMLCWASYAQAIQPSPLPWTGRSTGSRHRRGLEFTMVAPSSFSLPHSDDRGTVDASQWGAGRHGVWLYTPRQVRILARIPKILQFVVEQSGRDVCGFVRREKNELTRCPHPSSASGESPCRSTENDRLVPPDSNRRRLAGLRSCHGGTHRQWERQLGWCGWHEVGPENKFSRRWVLFFSIFCVLPFSISNPNYNLNLGLSFIFKNKCTNKSTPTWIWFV